MHRKTNLFYTSGPNSKFLTFSNYTESLTGNFLSTDTKIYPSMFLCLYIPGLESEINKKDFIKNYLVAYYENKLATLRDHCIDNNEKCEDHIKPLNYLIETIYKYIDTKYPGNAVNIKKNLISYISDISEQDYNGTYTDTICIIDFNSNYKFKQIKVENNFPSTRKYISMDEENLYGWENDFIINDYMVTENETSHQILPKYDEKIEDQPIYNYDSKISSIQFYSLQNNSDELNQVKFNIIIPLFDVTNINYHTKSYLFENLSLNNSNLNNTYYEILLKSNKENDLYRKNVPLGIWFADETIILKKDKNTGFSQNWSLLISSQFKPFPYSNIKDYQDDTTNSNAFPTFAMVLSRQNEILDEFRKLSRINQELSEKINSLQGQLNNKATESNIDKIKKDFIQFEYEMTSKYNTLKQEMKEFMENLAWKAAE